MLSLTYYRTWVNMIKIFLAFHVYYITIIVFVNISGKVIYEKLQPNAPLIRMGIKVLRHN